LTVKLTYDQSTDSLYINLVDRPSKDSREIAPGVVADFDEDGRMVGLDIEHASRVLDLSTLETDQLPSRKLRVG
jgi:uncharacterized protein YuzE